MEAGHYLISSKLKVAILFRRDHPTNVIPFLSSSGAYSVDLKINVRYRKRIWLPSPVNCVSMAPKRFYNFNSAVSSSAW